jgi:hypothetical protein
MALGAPYAWVSELAEALGGSKKKRACLLSLSSFNHKFAKTSIKKSLS